MKKLLVLGVSVLALFGLASCNKDEGEKGSVIKVCASELPHAQILNECVKGLVEEKGYTLEVTTLDWTLQNDAVANGEYDANYFQHKPYLDTYNGSVELSVFCKVHYEPLGIYKGKASSSLTTAKTVAICDDPSNAVRALELLLANGVISALPTNVDENGNKTLNFNGNKWTDTNGTEVYLISEELLAASRFDYDLACIPSNTALTGNVDSNLIVAVEEDPEIVRAKANIIAGRASDYETDEDYKNKIDALVEACLSVQTREYIASTFGQSVICNEFTQIDYRK